MRETGAGFLLLGLGIVSALLISVQASTRLLDPIRGVVATIASPIYLIAESPYLFSESVGDLVSSRDDLLAENAELERRILELSQVSQLYVSLKAENDRLRGLLGSQGRLAYEVLIAEMVGVVPSPTSAQIIIDKGRDASLKIGQAVLDAKGLFGQVVEVGQFTSRVLLLIDPDHAVPVQINRNGVRSIAGGTGSPEALELENVPISADIVEGDLVETSGLGGRFPSGYPVGVVTSVVVEPTSAYAQVSVRPLAHLDRSRHVLVIFKPETQVDLDFEEPDLVDGDDS